jgi:hypothetical protein
MGRISCKRLHCRPQIDMEIKTVFFRITAGWYMSCKGSLIFNHVWWCLGKQCELLAKSAVVMQPSCQSSHLQENASHYCILLRCNLDIPSGHISDCPKFKCLNHFLIMNLLPIIQRDLRILIFNHCCNLLFFRHQIIAFLDNNILNSCLNFCNNCLSTTLSLCALSNFHNLFSDIGFPKNDRNIFAIRLTICGKHRVCQSMPRKWGMCILSSLAVPLQLPALSIQRICKKSSSLKHLRHLVSWDKRYMPSWLLVSHRNSKMAWWIFPASYQMTTTPRYDVVSGDVHPSIARWMDLFHF